MSSCKALARRLRTRPISTAVIAAGVAVSIYKIYKKNKEEVAAEASPSLLSSLLSATKSFLPASIPTSPLPPTPLNLKLLSRSKSLHSTKAFLPTLRRRIEHICDVTETVRELKRLRASKADASSPPSSPTADEGALWESIKFATLRRFFLGYISLVLLSLVVQVQVALIEATAAATAAAAAAAISNEEGEGSTTEHNHNNNNSFAYDDVGQEVLDKTYSYFFGEGLTSMSASIDSVLRQHMSNSSSSSSNSNSNQWDIQTCMSVSRVDFVSVLEKVRDGIFARGSVACFFTSMETDDANNATVDDCSPAAAGLIEETWDVLESPGFEKALKGGLSVVWNLFVEREIKDGIFAEREVGVGVGGGEEGREEGSPPPEITNVEPPLANVVTNLKAATNSLFAVVEGRRGNGNGDGVFGGNAYLEAVNKERETDSLVELILETF